MLMSLTHIMAVKRVIAAYAMFLLISMYSYYCYYNLIICKWH